jgi:DNA-directed RNA polymerase specialized sigma24 family protein
MAVFGEIRRDSFADDWLQLSVSVTLRARFRVWQRREPVLARFADPFALVRYMRGPGPRTDKDAVLCAVLAWAKEEPLGGRVVLEVIRPGLWNLTGRLTRGAREREELRAILLASLWKGIREYPLERRPRRVAANLLLDALHATLVEVGKESALRAVLARGSTEARAAPVSVEGDLDGLLARAVSAGAVSSDEADLVLRTRIDGERLGDLAPRTGVSYNTLKLRRQRAERRLLMFLGFRPVPRGQQNRPSSFARVAGAGSNGPGG